jgi:hypothetical protein
MQALGDFGVESPETLVQRTSTSMATGCNAHARQNQPALLVCPS